MSQPGSIDSVVTLYGVASTGCVTIVLEVCQKTAQKGLDEYQAEPREQKTTWQTSQKMSSNKKTCSQNGN